MEIIKDYPPNIDEIDAVFHVKEKKNILYCYAPYIFNPTGEEIPSWILAHEKVHADQQGHQPKGWWFLYLNDPEFRLKQEIAAHQMEYMIFSGEHADRNVRSRYLHQIAQRLAGPMYGNLLTVEEAKRKIA